MPTSCSQKNPSDRDSRPELHSHCELRKEVPSTEEAVMVKGEQGMAWIRMIEAGDAGGELKAEFDRAYGRAGKVFNILKVQSLNPKTLHASMGLYLATMHCPSGLSQAERELVATVISSVNRCFY